MFNVITVFLSIVERNNISTTDLKNLQSKAEELTKRIEDLRQEKKDIISNSKNIPARWEEDEYVTYDGLPFYETDISASKAVRAITKLMIHINKAPIMLMGDAEKLGYKVLNELKQIADDNNKIMIFAEHNRQSTELKLYAMMRWRYLRHHQMTLQTSFNYTLW